MLDALIQAIWGPLGGVVAGLGAVVVALVLGRQKRAQGAAEQRAKDATETHKRVDAGRQAVQRGRDSGGDPDERLRRNDGRW